MSAELSMVVRVDRWGRGEVLLYPSGTDGPVDISEFVRAVTIEADVDGPPTSVHLDLVPSWLDANVEGKLTSATVLQGLLNEMDDVSEFGDRDRTYMATRTWRSTRSVTGPDDWSSGPQAVPDIDGEDV